MRWRVHCHLHSFVLMPLLQSGTFKACLHPSSAPCPVHQSQCMSHNKEGQQHSATQSTTAGLWQKPGRRGWAYLALRTLSCVLNLAACCARQSGSHHKSMILQIPHNFATRMSSPRRPPRKKKYGKSWGRTDSPFGGELVSHAAVLVERVNVPLLSGLLGCAACTSPTCSVRLHGQSARCTGTSTRARASCTERALKTELKLDLLLTQLYSKSLSRRQAPAATLLQPQPEQEPGVTAQQKYRGQ